MSQDESARGCLAGCLLSLVIWGSVVTLLLVVAVALGAR